MRLLTLKDLKRHQFYSWVHYIFNKAIATKFDTCMHTSCILDLTCSKMYLVSVKVWPEENKINMARVYQGLIIS